MDESITFKIVYSGEKWLLSCDDKIYNSNIYLNTLLDESCEYLKIWADINGILVFLNVFSNDNSFLEEHRFYPASMKKYIETALWLSL